LTLKVAVFGRDDRKVVAARRPIAAKWKIGGVGAPPIFHFVGAPPQRGPVRRLCTVIDDDPGTP
jgi:hypothetical protein